MSQLRCEMMKNLVLCIFPACINPRGPLALIVRLIRVVYAQVNYARRERAASYTYSID